MRLIVIPECSYEKYEAIRDTILEHIPFAILNDQYSSKKNTATFYFWGLEYIPPELQVFIKQPPVNRENWGKLRSELSNLFPSAPDEKLNCILCDQEIT